MQPLPHFAIDPLDALRSWPRDEPLMMLHSGGSAGTQAGSAWARWTILARPVEWQMLAAQCRRGDEKVAAARDVRRFGEMLHETAARRPASRPNEDQTEDAPPFSGGWIGAMAYELGELIEPTALRSPRADRVASPWPLAAFAWCDDVLAFDHEAQRWWATAMFPESLLESLKRSAIATNSDGPSTAAAQHFESSLERPAYERAVRRALDFIAAGDIFQVNVAQMLESRFTGSPRALAFNAFNAAQPRYGAYLELPGGQRIISLSPELFLAFDLASQARPIVTRPVKGTRPTSAAPAALATSAKDEAELNMIIDLMRNDLGRICAFGSVRTEMARMIETHPTVHHGVGEVHGRLRSNITFADIIEATFPAGSITGAPKIRAMQIIRELEPAPRDMYCGAIGYLSRTGQSAWSVAIRTLMLDEAHGDAKGSRRLRYGAGAGIVADSEPAAEYDECMVKTEVLRLALRQ